MEDKMKTLIIYYSNEGNTKIVAETIARQLGCYICQVKDLKKRKGFANKFTSTIDALCEFIGSKEKMPNYAHDSRLTII